MLEKPDLEDQVIISALQDEYGLQITQVTFLPLGYDVNTAVYRAVTEDHTAYFLKLRKGAFDRVSVALPQFIRDQGVRAVIAPLETPKKKLWGSFNGYKMILYPFIEGRNGYDVALADRHWVQLGAALKQVHSAQVPPALVQMIPREDYSPHWREMVRAFQAQVENRAFDEPVAAKLAAFMHVKRAEISYLVERAEQLGLALQSRSLDFVLCHSDIHPGNLLIGAEGALYIVDWDNPIFAPKERDLMFFGDGMSSDDPRAGALFYRGYSGDHAGRPEDVDRMALAYYRYERIIQDIAAFCEQLFLTTEGGKDREQAYQYFTGQFLPGNWVEIAYKTDTKARNGYERRVRFQ